MSRGLKNYCFELEIWSACIWGTKFFTAEILVMNLFSGVNMAGILSNWYPSGELMPF